MQSPEFIAQAELRYAKKSRKISLAQYIKAHTQRVENILKGSKAEELFANVFNGIKPKKAIKTPKTNRFEDNILNGVGREIKSGKVKNTKAFQKQFMKDIDIVDRSLNDIISYEWHRLEGIDYDALKWAHKYIEKNKLVDKLKIIIY